MCKYSQLDHHEGPARPPKSMASAPRWMVPITGFVALVWFVVRVLPKPSRAAYPCQRVAAPLASGFILWAAGIAGSAVLFRHARSLARDSRLIAAALCCVAATAVWWTGSSPVESAVGGTFIPADPPNQPFGDARGIFPGRVAWVHNPAATTWDGSNGFWSDHVDQEAVNNMFSQAIRWVSGTSSDSAAWQSIFHYFNNRLARGDRGYLAGEKISIKVNMVQCGVARHHQHPGNAAYNTPQLVLAVLRQLVDKAGVHPADITVYDASNYIPLTIFDLCNADDLGEIRFVDKGGGDGRFQAEPDFSAPILHADPSVPTRWLPRAVSEADYMINLAHLKGHFLAGVTLCAKNQFGSTWVESGERFWPGEAIHSYINAYDWLDHPSWGDILSRPMGSYNPIVEHMGHQHLGEKTLLFLVDGLYSAVHQNESMLNSPKWQSAPFNDHWTSSVFASLDGVAIDSVCLDFLRSEPTQTFVADAEGNSTADDYLHEAALAHDPPSGSFYDPEEDGAQLTSLGVHEHWNNAADKMYSRNLGIGEGIELISGPLPSSRYRRSPGRRVRP